MSSSESKALRALETFESGGRQIRVETFVEPQQQSAPSIIVLHGATGVEFANRFIAHLAQNLASQGFVVHLLHYFDRTGTHYADDATIKRSSGAWLQTVHDAVAFIAQRRPGSAIGMFGYSLGGYLVAAESVSHGQISAAVVLSGGLDEASARMARHAPPTLILHGSADRRVPESEARRLASVLQKAGGTPELHIYPGEGHIMGLAAYGDVVQRSVSFLRVHLARRAT